MHDLVIRGALVYDGLGGPPRRESVAVHDGRIAAVGADVGRGRESLDAVGLALMPGIIDTHTHYDAQITWDPWVDPSPALGVTTVVIGNCGFTIAPCRTLDRDLVMKNLTQVEGMSLDALRAGVRWEFETFPEYLAQLERAGVGPNVAAFVGHSSVRSYVMGEDAVKRTATADEVERMRAIVAAALDAGAIGFSTTTSPSHNGHCGIPMPSRLADERELRALVGALGDARGGVFMLTKGEDTSIGDLESLAAETGRPVLVAALLHNSTNPASVFDDLAAIAAAQSRGHPLWGAVSCCPLTFEFTLHSPYPLEGLTGWGAARGRTGAAFRSAIRDPGFRAAIKQELAQPAKVRLFNGEWDKLHLVAVAHERHRALEGRSVAALAREAGVHPLDWLLDFALAEDLDTVFAGTLLNSDEAAVARLITDPCSVVSLSDAGAHLTFFCDAGFGLQLLGHWARDRRALAMEEAVRRLTSQAADLFGLVDRGRIAPGAHGRPDALRPADGGAGAEPQTVRSAGRRIAPRHTGGRRARRVGERRACRRRARCAYGGETAWPVAARKLKEGGRAMGRHVRDFRRLGSRRPCMQATTTIASG
jgi:N-acyl-D-aspartate/D-glutamate deacylase